MTRSEAYEGLPSVYSDFTAEDFRAELDRVLKATAVEREWMAEANPETYIDDYAIRQAVRDEKLAHIGWGVGFVTIPKLFNWTIERSDPDHEFHYSAPYAVPEVAAAIGAIGLEWARRYRKSDEYTLSISSLIRSEAYQKRLAEKHNKVTVPADVGMSSHVPGWAWDIDGCGLYRRSQTQTFQPIHPRVPGVYRECVADVRESREVLREILNRWQELGVVNVVEELIGTQQHSFHVCVNPNG